MKRSWLWPAIFILIISLIFSSDLFMNAGTPATFDGRVHISNIAQFYRALNDGEFPARWGTGFANYGMPIPIIAQQTTSYLGALFTFITHDVVLSYAIVVLIGAVLSNLFYYKFLRIYTSVPAALLGTFIFNLAPYRIINIYIRGSIPEFFGSVFLPLILIGLYKTIKEKNKLGPILISLATAGLLLTHPFLFVIYSFLFVPYGFFLIFSEKHRKKPIIRIIISTMLGFGLAAYFIIPLFSEIKYFYYGQEANHFVPNQYLNLKHFIDPNWYYNYETDIYTRGHFIKSGVPEIVIACIFTIWTLFRLFVKKYKIDTLQSTIVFGCITTIFLMTRFAVPLYENINPLGGIQHAWRMLSAFIFLPPAILALWVNNKKNNTFVILVIMIFFMIIRFPQLYGKNYVVRPQQSYFDVKENLHGTIMNTIWTSNTTDYRVEKNKPAIFEGKGEIVKQEVKNASRKYEVRADTDIKMVDYTFYYPGWRVYIDGIKTEIQFQDPNYRGVITYVVPKGMHEILVKFEETKIRLIANTITIGSIVALLIYAYIPKFQSFRRKSLSSNAV